MEGIRAMKKRKRKKWKVFQHMPLVLDCDPGRGSSPDVGGDCVFWNSENGKE